MEQLTMFDAMQQSYKIAKKIRLIELFAGVDVTITIDKSRSHFILNALQEIQEYRKIGTLDECRAAVEKQKPKKPIKDALQYKRYTSTYVCPSCGRGFTGTRIADYCYHCGQALDWSDWSDEDV